MQSTNQKLKALIIDDDPSLRRLAQVSLERNGFLTSTASEGSEGVRQALASPPDVIILDLMMDGLNGFEVCKMLRANSSLKNTPIVITSGKSYLSDKDKSINLGADAYIVKPYSPKELVDEVILQIKKRKGNI